MPGSKLTWNDLAIFAISLPPEYRDMQVMSCIDGEFEPVDLLESLDDDILSDGHPYLEVCYGDGTT